MPMTAIRIHGYRGFASLGQLNLAVPDGNPGSGLSIVTGPNNSGKSTILEAVKARMGYQEVSFTQGTRNQHVEEVHIEYVVDGEVQSIRSVDKGSSETVKRGIGAGLKVFCLPSRRAFAPYFGKSVWNRDQFVSNSTLPTQRSSSLSAFESRLFGMLKNKKSFNEVLGRILGYEPEWTIDQSDQGSYYLKFFTGPHSHSSDGMGEGIVSAFAIADALYDSSAGELIAIDEPELSLHPALQRRLAEVVASYASDRQVLIATHSPYFVNLKALADGATIARVATGKDGTIIHQLDAPGRAAIRSLIANNVSNPHIMGLDAREMFFLEDRILLTEGQEDVVLYPTVFAQLGFRMPASLFGWGAGGAGNIKHLCTVFRELGFEKVAAVFDNDKAADCEELQRLFPNYLSEMIPARDVKTKPARSGGGEIEGLLDRELLIREELKGPTQVLLGKLSHYFAPRAFHPISWGPFGATILDAH